MHTTLFFPFRIWTSDYPSAYISKSKHINLNTYVYIFECNHDKNCVSFQMTESTFFHYKCFIRIFFCFIICCPIVMEGSSKDLRYKSIRNLLKGSLSYGISSIFHFVHLETHWIFIFRLFMWNVYGTKYLFVLLSVSAKHKMKLQIFYRK